LTPQDRELDPSRLFQSNPLKLYRLVRQRYASLSGIGAAVHGGRWNQVGQEAIYTSTEVSVPWLERLVHTPKNVIPANLALMEIHVDISDYSTEHANPIAIFPSLRAANNNWLGTTDPESQWAPFAIAVPSVVVPVWNVVLYPMASKFWDRVTLFSVEPTEFDVRLFPSDAVVEKANA